MTDCTSCRHAFPATTPDGKIDFTKKVCKESRPTPLLVPDGSGGAMIQSFFPLVGKGVWCSRHDNPNAAPAESAGDGK